MTYLLDTNLISDVRRRVSSVTSWFAGADPATIHFSVITIGEIEAGIVRQRRTDPGFATQLAHWLDRLRADYAERVLPVSEPIALEWGRISAGRTRGPADALIAATAITHGLTLVTRNIRDFEDLPIKLLNPWSS